MIFKLYKEGKYLCEGNPLMLISYTDKEIKDFYSKFNIKVEIKRG